ncbi:kinase domain-containing protein [Cercophora scortea]|uniref:non-specific serine/threonine protein kinase n=1 Tax=Cercophora scortea TaxID=314031 RepID=A0AAE0I9W4_9PEZI|nr:kinase domain-containing protein [Cercophora scortea]
MDLDVVTEMDGMMPPPYRPSESDRDDESVYCLCPFDTEDLEDYEPGGFHPVHLGDTYDNRYKVVHKLGFGGFSIVWLARDPDKQQWVALKIIKANESPTYESRSVVTNHKHVHPLDPRLFAMPIRNFWIDGPNGRHLCIVLPVLGPNLSSLSTGFFSRLQPAFVKTVSLQAGQALVALHANGICHGDFTANNIALRLVVGLNGYDEADIVGLFGEPQKSPVMLYSGKSPRPHAPDYSLRLLDFRSSTTNLLTDKVCIIDLTNPSPRARHQTVPGYPRSEDLFFDYDTGTPADVLQQIAKTIDGLHEEWRWTRFDDDGRAVLEGGEPIYLAEETTSPEEQIQGIFDEPHTRSINLEGEDVEPVDVPLTVFEEFNLRRVPYPEVFGEIIWKPTAVCIDGGFVIGYENVELMAKAFPKISAEEGPVLRDLLSKIFVHDPAHRIKAEDLVRHSWFH